MTVPFIQTAFSSGELAPSLWGHIDLAKYHTALATCRNCFVGYRGGAYSRAGTAYIGRSKQRPDLGQFPPRIINWQFNNLQGYMLEFGDNYVRFVFSGAVVTEAQFAIVGVTQSNPCTVTTSSAHGFAVGDWVIPAGVGGPNLQMNTNEFIVSSVPLATTFTISDLDGNPIDSTSWPAYVTAGTVARVYQIASPYAARDLRLLKFTQSADVMSLAHPNYPPHDLARLGPLNWTLLPTAFASSIAAPASISASATTNPSQATTPKTLPAAYAYQVTAVDAIKGQESQPSPIANITNSVDMGSTAGSEVVSWSPSAGAGFYNIYRAPTSYNTGGGSTSDALPVPVGALFGFVGQSYGNQFVDTNITPDFAITPPQHRNPFAPGQIIKVVMTGSSGVWTFASAAINTATGSGFVSQVVIVNGDIVAVIILDPGEGFLPTDTLFFVGDGSSASATITVSSQTGSYPGLVSYFQQRRVYASTSNQPDTYWMSQPGAFTNFDSSIPVTDSDAISGTPWSQQVNGIQWMITAPLGLITFTGAGVWQVGAPGGSLSSPSAITPSNQVSAPQSAIGCSATVEPLKINWDILYLEHNGYSVRDLTYQIFFNIYAGTEISWPSSHLLIGYEILNWCYCDEPYRIIWATRNDGTLLSLTYLKEQEVAGWARSDTQGQVVSLCSVTEPPVDALYLAVLRVLPGGTSSRYLIERMDNRLWQGLEDSWCVDSGVATPTTFPSATLFASSGSGAVTFVTSTAVFSPGSVNQVIRYGGGIALINGYFSPFSVTANWVFPCQQFVPNDPDGGVLPQNAGGWSMSPQVNVVGGLTHLIGKTVVGLADGVPIGPLTVQPFGIINLPFPASKVVIGLGYTAQAQSVYLDAGQPTVQGRRKSISAVTVRQERSALSQVGANQPDSSGFSPPPLFRNWPNLPQATAANVSPPPPASYTTTGGAAAFPLFTGDQRVLVKAEWVKQGQVAVQQTKPLPLGLLAFIPEVLEGDLPESAISPRQPPQQRQRPGP